MRKLQKIVVVLVVMVLAGFTGLIAGEEAAGKSHEVTVKVVSVDTEAKTITFTKDGEETTAPVLESAADQLADVKSGEMYVLTCQDTEEGSHEGVIKIKHAEG